MATAREDIEDLITCEICYERFTDPRSLPCLHAFCLTCIQGIHRRAKDSKLKDNQFRCPKCQSVSVLPGNSTDNLPKFFHANTFSGIFERLDRKHYLVPAMCEMCKVEHKELIRYCFTCSKAMCKDCLKKHSKNRRYNNHVHVEVTTSNLQALICEVHDENVEAYCTDCCVAVCAQCQLEAHEDHNIHDFINRNLSDKIHDTLQETSGLLEIEKMQEEFNTHISGLHHNITSHTNQLIAQIIKQDGVLHAKLESLRDQTNKELEKLKQQEKYSANLIANTRAQLTKLAQPIPDLPSVGVDDTEKLITAIKHKLSQIKGDHNVKLIRYQFDSKQTTVDLGSITPLPTSGDDDISNTLHQGSEPDLPSPTLRLISTYKCVQELYDVAWTPDGDLLVGTSTGLRMCDVRGEERSLPSALSGLRGDVWSLAVHKQTQTVALISFVNMKWMLCVRSLGAQQWKPNQLSLHQGCYCVQFTDDGDLLIGNRKRKLVKYKKTNLTQLWQRHTEHPIEYIAVFQDKILISGGKQLSVLSEDGQLFSSFPVQSGTNRLLVARGVCSDASGNVYVVEKEQQAVLMFTSDGRYVRDVVHLKGIYTIAMLDERYMAIRLSNKIDIYEI